MWVARLSVSILALALHLSAQSPRDLVHENHEGRYQILAAKVSSTSKANTVLPLDAVFILDTTTGHVWMYDDDAVFTDKSGTEVHTPRHFRSVFVEGLEGSLLDYLNRATWTAPATSTKYPDIFVLGHELGYPDKEISEAINAAGAERTLEFLRREKEKKK